MLAMSVRLRRAGSCCGARRQGTLDLDAPSVCSTVIGATTWVSEPFGPFTVTVCPSMSTGDTTGDRNRVLANARHVDPYQT